MITIKITNPKQIIENEKGWLMAKIAPLSGDIQERVEAAIVEELKQNFEKRNIKAIISMVRDE